MWMFFAIIIAFCLFRFGDFGQMNNLLKHNIKAKKWLVVTLAIVAIICFIGPNSIINTALDAMERTAKSVSIVINPPPPEERWKGSTIIEAPIESDWSKIPMVKDLHYGVSRWKITALLPNNKGCYEIFAKEWDKPFRAGGKGGHQELPSLGDSLWFKIRSLDDKPMRFKLEWY